ncbi:MAG: MarR family transcriptional regulator [Candidatus Hydrogenedens sp.]|nr:MarR family transcriptional regulator [Candidatus Hydrogenedens sp.]
MTELEQSIKLKRGFRSLREEAMLNLVRTVDQTQIAFTRLFREHGITPQQYNVLRILSGAGEPLPCLEVAARMVTVVPAITGLIDRLEKAGLAVRKRCADDRRIIFVELTPGGRGLLKALEEPVDRLHEELLGQLTDTELKTLIRLAAKARETAEERNGA